MLLEHDGGKERRLETVGGAVVDDSPKTAERRADGRRFNVIRQPVEEALDGERRPQPRDEPALLGAELITKWSGPGWIGESQCCGA